MASRGIRIAPKSRILNAIPLTGHELLPFPGSFVRAAQYIRGLAPLTSFRGKSIDQRLGCCWISFLPSKISSDLRTKQIYFLARKMAVWKSVQCSALCNFYRSNNQGKTKQRAITPFLSTELCSSGV